MLSCQLAEAEAARSFAEDEVAPSNPTPCPRPHALTPSLTPSPDPTQPNPTQPELARPKRTRPDPHQAARARGAAAQLEERLAKAAATREAEIAQIAEIDAQIAAAEQEEQEEQEEQGAGVQREVVLCRPVAGGPVVAVRATNVRPHAV